MNNGTDPYAHFPRWCEACAAEHAATDICPRRTEKADQHGGVAANYDRLVTLGGGSDFTRGVEPWLREQYVGGTARADLIALLTDAAQYHARLCAYSTGFETYARARDWAMGETERVERHWKASGDGPAPAEKPQRFRFITDADLEAQEPPAARIDGVLFDQSLAVLVGPPEMFKSFIGVDMAGSVHCEEPWAGRTTRRGAAAYVVAEGRGRFGLRTRAWRAHRGMGDPIGMRFLPEPVQFMQRGETDDLLRALEQLPEPPALLVVDTMARCLVGGEENSARDVGLFIAGVDTIRVKTGAAVLVIHHTDRGGQRERGSTALRGAADTVLIAEADGDFVTVRCDKQKDAPHFEPITFRKRIIDFEDGTSSCVMVPVSEAERSAPRGIGDLPNSVRTILDTLSTTFQHGATTAKLLDATGLKDRTFYLALKNTKQLALVEEDDRLNRLTPAGRSMLG